MSSIKKHKPRQTINGSVKTSSAVYGELTDNNKNRVLRDYNQLYNKPSIEGVILIGDKVLEDFGITRVLYNTKEGWNEETTLVGEEHTLYVYTDYDTDSDGNNIAGIKLGDGDSLLMNSPFLDSNSLKYKGTLGTNGDITTLPPASADNKHFVYSVITDNTYDSKPAVVDDLFWSDGSVWHIIKTHDTQYEDATPSSDGLMSATDKAKLNDIESGAEVNQNAFSNVKVGNTTVVADSKTDTFELTEGNGITLTPDTFSDSVSIAHGDTSNQESVENSGRTYVQSLVVDDFGHVLGISSATETVVNTDENVTQTPTTDNERFPVLLSGTDDYSEHTEGVKKSSSMLFNPSAKSLNIGELHVLSAVPSIIITQKTGGGGGRPFEYKTILIQGGDISLLEGGTWDGTNSSLKDAVTSAKSTVTQEQTDDSAWDYELLFGHTSDIPYDDNDRTEATRKSKYLRFNPYDKSLVIGDEAVHNSGSSVVINEALSNDTYQGLTATSDDISLTGISTNTWDGTNRSLKNTIAGIYTAIDNLPDPMVFKGTVGAAADNPTVTSLPVDGTATIGDTYKCITDGTYGGKVAKVGDTLVCLTKTVSANTWELIPSGDETSGTVTNVATGVGLTTSDGQPITSSGTVKTKLKSETASVLEAGTRTNVANREYPVGVDANGDLSVNVPWQGGAGLEYFEETEDALYGVVNQLELVNDPKFKISSGNSATLVEYVLGELSGIRTTFTIEGDSSTLMMYYTNDYATKSPIVFGSVGNSGWILALSQSDFTVHVHLADSRPDTPTPNVYGDYLYSTMESGWQAGYIINPDTGEHTYGWGAGCAYKGSATVDGVTWYGVIMALSNDAIATEKSSFRSLTDYLPVADYPMHDTVHTAGYYDMEDLIASTVPLVRDISDHNYNGISREANLAFFAGANDEHGEGANIKMYRDGTYEGFDMVGATSLADGKKGVVPQPLIADRNKFLKGDGTWETPPNTTYEDFSGSTHGLVPPALSGDSGKFLKGDGTWSTITSLDQNVSQSNSTYDGTTPYHPLLSSSSDGSDVIGGTYIPNYISYEEVPDTISDTGYAYSALTLVDDGDDSIQITPYDITRAEEWGSINGTDYNSLGGFLYNLTDYITDAIYIDPHNGRTFQGGLDTGYLAISNKTIEGGQLHVNIASNPPEVTMGDKTTPGSYSSLKPSEIDVVRDYVDSQNVYTDSITISANDIVLYGNGTVGNTWDGTNTSLKTAIANAGTTVVANPSGAATTDLNKLQVGSSIYGISSGTNVVANPIGTATSDLTKLQVGNSIYNVGASEIVTPILNSNTWSNWDEETTGGMTCYTYTTDKTYLAFGVTNEYTDSDRVMAVYTIPLPSSVKKIRYKFLEQRNDSQDPTQDMYKVCVGVKTTLDTTNYTTPTDNDFIAKKLYQFDAYGTTIEDELEFISASPVYLYITANGFACTFSSIEVVEYESCLNDLDDVEITNPSNGQTLVYNSTSGKFVNDTSGGGSTYTDVTGTLTAGNTSITLSDASITTSSTLDFYTDTFGVNPTNAVVSTGSVVLTFETQQSNLGVKVRVW